MKKSKKFITLFVIVLVLALCVSTFAACGAKKITQTKFEDSLVNGINGLIPENGHYFGIDAAASYTYQKGKESTRYDLIIQGTVDTNPDVASTDTQLRLELTETKTGAAPKTLLGLYYKDKPDGGAAAYEDNAPKLFLNINDQYKFAYNTYSIKKLVKDLAPKTATSDMLEIAGFELSADNIVSAIMTMLTVEDSFKTKTVKKEVHMTCVLNPNLLIDGMLGALIGESAEKIDDVLGQIGSDLTAEKLMGLDIDIPMTLTTRYTKVKKGGTPKLLGGSLVINLDKERPIKIVIGGETIIDTAIPEGKVTIGVDKVEILSGQKVEIATPTSGYTMINPLNISLDAKLKITNSTTGVTVPYDVIFRANANPIPIAYGVDGWDIKEAVFKNLGMIHFSIISEADKDEDRKTAIIDLAYDPKNTGSDSVFASLSLGTLGTISTQFSLSAMEGLMDAIQKFMGDKTTNNFYNIAQNDAKALTNQSDKETNWLEALKPAITDLLTGGIMGMINTFGGLPRLKDETDEAFAERMIAIEATLVNVNGMVGKMIDNKDIKLGTVARPTQENLFLELNIKKVASAVLGSGIVDDGTANIINSVLGLVDSALGGDIINLEFTGVGYGTVPNDYNATRFFKANLRGDSNFIKSINDFNSPTIANEMKNGITAAKFMTTIEFNKNINMKYTDWKNNTGNKVFKPMIISGFDKNVKGTQTVTIGFMDASNHAALGAIIPIIGGFIKDDPYTMTKIPFGLIRYTFEVNII